MNPAGSAADMTSAPVTVAPNSREISFSAAILVST
jgi:hypothetical protein